MRRITIAAALPLLAAAWATAQEPVPGNPFRPFDQTAFEAHAATLGADEEVLARYRAACSEVGVGPATDELLQELVAAYGAAVRLAEDGDPRAALSLAELAGQGDAYVRGHARYHLGRVFLDADDPERAVEVLADFLREDRNRTPLDAEVAFFYATALAEMPLPDQAAHAFGEFLVLFPGAPERYRAVALQRKAELEAQFQNPLHEIADQMKICERDIRKTDTGEPTQERQEDIVAKLQEIIEEMERQQQSSGAPSGNTQPSGPAANSAAPPGQSRIGNLQNVSNVVDRWGELQDRERDKIEADVQSKLPGRYRKLLEDYYRKLGRSQ